MKIKITANFRASRCLPFEDWKRIMSPKMRLKSLGTFERRDWFAWFHYFRSTQRTKWNQEKAKAKQIALHTRCMTVLQSLTDHLRKKMKTTEWKRQRWWRKWNGWEAWKEGKFLSAGHWQLLVLLRLFSRIYYGQWILMKTGNLSLPTNFTVHRWLSWLSIGLSCGRSWVWLRPDHHSGS